MAENNYNFLHSESDITIVHHNIHYPRNVGRAIIISMKACDGLGSVFHTLIAKDIGYTRISNIFGWENRGTA